MSKLLIVEDDGNICQLLELLLKDNHKLTIVNTGTEALLQVNQAQFDLILLDLMLPGVTGESVLTTIRKTSQTPIIITTAIDDKAKIVELLKLGADDYLTKPFNLDELQARIDVQLRKINHEMLPDKTFAYKNLSLNPENLELRIGDAKLTVAQKEYQIMALLINHPNKIFTKENLYERVWQENYLGGENTLNVHLSNLRKKLKAADPETDYIETVWGMGIRLAKEKS
ncbi:response regulator transcription factor [Lactococcus laudensis]|uniref:Response regulator transcription factor n=1 Tax=Pseudolactococcus laudensis TaxID=1494461 RepID=A0A7V8SIS4_9LACT|nr:response regulator transcription factor [Lactococcus laudensis]MBA0015556.1 response regulator transcription factor [Lactococcus laudensis]MBW9282300.1 DNA-binding response regulator [Lactococcus laudensis]